MFLFRKIWRALFSCYLRFEIRFFALLLTKLTLSITLPNSVFTFWSTVYLTFILSNKSFYIDYIDSTENEIKRRPNN